MRRRKSFFFVGPVLGLAAAGAARATLISGWVSDLNPGMTEGEPGTFWFTDAPGNTAAHASFADISLGVGDQIKLTLTAVNGVTSGNQWGNIQFRYGLFNNNSQSGIANWLGYWVGNSASGNTAGVWERTDGNYFSIYGATQIFGTVATGSAGTAVYTPPGTYAVSLTLTRTSETALQIDWSMIQTLDSGGNPVTDVYVHTGSFVDETPSTFIYNRVGFLVTGGAFSGTVTLSGIDVSHVPAIPPLLGDTNGDGVVDLADYNNVVNNLGASGPNQLGDTNNDQVVDLADYNNVVNNLGATRGGGLAVPEPATGLGAGVLLSLAGRRRRSG